MIIEVHAEIKSEHKQICQYLFKASRNGFGDSFNGSYGNGMADHSDGADYCKYHRYEYECEV